MTRPSDKYEQRLERITDALRVAVAAHDTHHDCAGEWCEYRLDAVDEVFGVAFLPSEAEAFLADCSYLLDWSPGPGDFLYESVRDCVVAALVYDARGRLYTFGDHQPPFEFRLLDPATTWKPDDA